MAAIARSDRRSDIYCAPASSFVADFIGTMNRISGKAEGNTLRFAGGIIPLGADAAGATQVMFRPEDVQLVRCGCGKFQRQGCQQFFSR